MESYIRRPKELREQKWTNRRHFSKTSRPLNIFLLYRKAVSERAKKCADGATYSELSKIAGASWKNESDQIRNPFKNYAKLEKKNRKKTFSDYQTYSKETRSTEASNGKRKGRGYEDQSDCDNDSQHLGYSTRKKEAKVGMENSNNMKQNGSYSWQYAPDDIFNILDPEHDRLPYLTTWRYSNSGEDPVQMLANHNSEFDIKDFQGNSQADIVTSSATTYVESSVYDHNLLLTAMEQPGRFDEGTINPKFLDLGNHDNRFQNLSLSSSEYTRVGGDNASSNLEYTQEGGFWSSLSQNQDWKLDNYTTSVSHSSFEELFGQTKE